MKCVRSKEGVLISVEMATDEFGSPMAGTEQGARIVCTHEVRTSDRGAFGGSVIAANREGFKELARYCLALAYCSPTAEDAGYHEHVLSTIRDGQSSEQMELTLALLPKSSGTPE